MEPCTLGQVHEAQRVHVLLDGLRVLEAIDPLEVVHQLALRPRLERGLCIRCPIRLVAQRRGPATAAPHLGHSEVHHARHLLPLYGCMRSKNEEPRPTLHDVIGAVAWVLRPSFDPC